MAEGVLFFTCARRLRRFAGVHDCVTLPDFFATRFGDHDGRLRLTLAVVILLFMVSYVAAQFAGGGKAIAAGFGISNLAGVLVTAGIGLGSPGNPHIIVRYMSIADERQLVFAGIVGTFWNVVMAAGAVTIGLVGRVWFPEAALLPGGDTESLYPVMAQQHLHPVLFGIVVSSVFAALMSTADSQLLVAASSVVRDVYQRVLNAGREVPERALVRLSRLVVALLVLAALVMGAVAQELVFWLVLFAWAGLGASLGPTMILALYWKRTTRAGVFAGLAVGALTTVVWYLTPALKSRLYELIPAFALSLLATVVVSLLTRPPEEAEGLMDAMEGRGGGSSPI